MSRKDLTEQEAEQIALYEQYYRDQRPTQLKLVEADWTKMDDPGPSLNAYVESVRRLGPLKDKHVLDLGCGDGWLSIILAKRGARVTGIDISAQGVEIARERARINDVADRTAFEVASIYAMPVENGRFDLVIGQAILHHVEDKAKLANELHRVLKPGGRGVFAEPLGNSLILERVRRVIPIYDPLDDPEEWKHQFKYSDADTLRRWFDVTITEMQFFSRIERLWPNPVLLSIVGRFDLFFLKALPFLKRYARSAVVELRRSG